MLTLDRVYKAKRVLSEVVRKTDMIRAKNISSQCDVYLKTENLQVTGSFKVRGSYFKISQLSDEEKAKGVIACSAGNHAQGVALAATKNGIKSLICLPDGAPISKVEATKRYGADVCLVKGVYDDAYNKAIELQKEKGYTFIHPFNDPDVIAGQGTIGLEILEQLPDVDAVVVPIGGGGLIAGVAYTIKQINPNCKVFESLGRADPFDGVVNDDDFKAAGAYHDGSLSEIRAQLQPGDLIDTPGHVGIYIGNGMVRSRQSSAGINDLSLDDFNATFGGIIGYGSIAEASGGQTVKSSQIHGAGATREAQEAARALENARKQAVALMQTMRDTVQANDGTEYQTNMIKNIEDVMRKKQQINKIAATPGIDQQTVDSLNKELEKYAKSIDKKVKKKCAFLRIDHQLLAVKAACYRFV